MYCYFSRKKGKKSSILDEFETLIILNYISSIQTSCQGKNILQNRFVSCTLKGSFVSVCPLSYSKLTNENEQDFGFIWFYFIPNGEKNTHKCIMPMVFTEKP